MTLKTVLVEIEDTAIDVLKEAGTIIEGIVITIGQQLVAKAKATPVGTMAMNVISLLESHQMTGEAKMASLIGMVTPAITHLEASGGLKGLETSVDDFVREFAQSAFNDFAAAIPKFATLAGSMHSPSAQATVAA